MARPQTSAGHHPAIAAAAAAANAPPVSYKLKRFLLRYYPPGVILESENKFDPQQTQQKTIDLLDLALDSDPEQVVSLMLEQEPQIGEKRRALLQGLVEKLIVNLSVDRTPSFHLFKLLQAHILPLTNCGFNKSGARFITGSYDRTCKVWNTEEGTEALKLEGHKNVVYAISFNNPFGDKIATGSFDKTCKIWDSATGQCLHTLVGHEKEIVCVAFNPQGDLLATGSTDHTARLWNVHTGACLRTLLGHEGEISSSSFNFTSDTVVSGSIDKTVRLWDVATGRCINTIEEHTDEILDVVFNATGTTSVQTLQR